jgi:predicted MFS family arabinose efflux permease
MTKLASTEVQEPEGSAEKPGVSPLIVALIALCAGITVSNLYLTQPLLPLVAESLRVSPTQVGFLPTIGQAGYALGVLLIVPLGDVLRRRELLTFAARPASSASSGSSAPRARRSSVGS